MNFAGDWTQWMGGWCQCFRQIYIYINVCTLCKQLSDLFDYIRLTVFVDSLASLGHTVNSFPLSFWPFCTFWYLMCVWFMRGKYDYILFCWGFTSLTIIYIYSIVSESADSILKIVQWKKLFLVLNENSIVSIWSLPRWININRLIKYN